MKYSHLLSDDLKKIKLLLLNPSSQNISRNIEILNYLLVLPKQSNNFSINTSLKYTSVLGLFTKYVYTHEKSSLPIDNILEFFQTYIITSKVPINSQVLYNLSPVFCTFTETALSEIITQSHKLLLRSPEVIIEILYYIAKNQTLDFLSIFSNQHLQLLLSQFKSSNSEIQNNTLLLLKTLLKSCNNQSTLKKITDLIIPAIQQSTPSSKIFLLNVFSLFNPSPEISTHIISLLQPLITRETNIQALEHISEALVVHSQFGFPKKTISLPYFQIFSSRLKDSKTDIQLIFTNTILNLLLNEIDILQQLEFVKFFHQMLETIQSSGIALLDPKKETLTFLQGVQAARFCLAALSLSNDSDFLKSQNFQKTFLKSPTSFLYNEKLYTKLISTASDFEIFSSLLIQISHSETIDEFDALFYSKAVAWMVLCSPSACYHKMVLKLSDLSRIQSSIHFKQLMLRAIDSHLLEYSKLNTITEPLAWASPPQRSSNSFGVRIYDCIQALLPKEILITEEIKNWILGTIVTISHPIVREVVGSDAWIRFCFKNKLLPKDILKAYGNSLMTSWLSNTQDSNTRTRGNVWNGAMTKAEELFRQATLSSISLFTDINPKQVCSLLVPWMLDHLTDQVLNTISFANVSIWSTPEDELCFNPISKTKKIDKTPKNAEEKWELDLRNKLNSKVQKITRASLKDNSFSKSDKEAMNAQFQKEAEVRKDIDNIRLNLLCSFELLDSLLLGVSKSIDHEAKDALELYIYKIYTAVFNDLRILEIMQKEDDEIIEDPILNGSRIVESIRKIYKYLSQFPDDVIPDDFVHCLVRAQGMSQSELYMESYSFSRKSLFESISFLLKGFQNLRLSALDFSLLFPLLEIVIMKKDEMESAKDQTFKELCLIASDILLVNSGIECSASALPRKEILGCLITLLERFPLLRASGRDAISALIISTMDSIDIEEENDSRNEKEIEFTETITHDISNVLIDGLLSGNEGVRESCISGLCHITVPNDLLLNFNYRLWVSICDSCDAVSTEASRLWTELYNGQCVDVNLLTNISEMIVHEQEAIREASGKSLCIALKSYPDQVKYVLDIIYNLYDLNVQIPTPKYDSYGIVIPESLNAPDKYEARSGIAMAIKYLVPVLSDILCVESVFNFLIKAEALGDRDSTVQKLMMDAGLSIIESYGKKFVKELLQIFDSYLSNPAIPSDSHDRIREAVVIFSGTLAKHLSADDKLIPDVISKLIETLKTPSESVQKAVSDCLPSLLKVNNSQAQSLIKMLLEQLFSSPKYGERKGASYGIAGIVKGCGLSSLRDFKIMDQLKSAVEDKKSVTRREGALFAYETLSFTLGRLFEPYVIQILPYLLSCYGDSAKEVREATHDACKTIMSKLSAHCVKLILPSILAGLEDRSWRTKTGSIDVLGSMAYLAPKQLSQSLPTVIPRLSEVLSDTHPKVHAAAKQSLFQFGEVIKNPEIQALVPVLIAALVDPNNKTNAALTSVLETSFAHYIDSPSLALLVPILKRAFKERGMETKTKCGQIVGNLVTLTNKEDLIPYLSTLMPGIHEILIDPVPEVRATASKALGILVENMGESHFPNLIEELITVLKSDAGAVDRSGAAQGLSEVIAGLGLARLESLLPEIIANASSYKLAVREGFMTLFIYLPVTHGEAFTPYLSRIIPPILRGLSDENDSVREIGLKSGQVIVRNYAISAIELLLPELEIGLFSDNWRIRQNSLQLLGDLLYRLAGTTDKGNMVDTDEMDSGTESGKKALIRELGQQRYNEVLSCLYLVRSDSNAIVRQASLHVWKSIIVNTPKTLKEILPVLMTLVISSLASPNKEKREVAGRTLGDLVGKMGDLVLYEIIPVLENGLQSDNADIRQGVCLGMTEIMYSGKDQVSEFVFQYIPLVKKALVDSSPEVRESAAKAFDVLHQILGTKAIDDILPSLLNDLKEQGDSTMHTNNPYALDALREIMQVRSNAVFPVLLPTLLSKPITKFNAGALSSLINVAGSSLNRRLGSILSPLMDGLEQNDDAVPEILNSLKVLLSQIDTPEGVHQVMSTLFKVAKDGNLQEKISGNITLQIFSEVSKGDFTSYTSDWITNLINGFNTVDQTLLESVWKALDSFIKRIKKDDLHLYVNVSYRAICDLEQHLKPNDTIRGFCLPKGISPILPIFLQGIMAVNGDVRETSANGLGKLVSRTSVPLLSPFVIQITGPLIRVIGDRFNPSVKSAILQTLSKLLEKVPIMLRPFLPQLQRTFVKSLSETVSSSAVCENAAKCLSLLIPLQPRLDPLIVELVQAYHSCESSGVKISLLDALYGLLLASVKSSREISDSSKLLLQKLLNQIYSSNDDTTQQQSVDVADKSCKLTAVLFTIMDLEETKAYIQSMVSSFESSTMKTFIFIKAMKYGIEQDPLILNKLDLYDNITKLLMSLIGDDKELLCQASIELSGALLLVCDTNEIKPITVLLPVLVQTMTNVGKSASIRRDAIIIIKQYCKRNTQNTASCDLSILIPGLMTCVRERTLPVKLAAERALLYALNLKKDDVIFKAYLKSIQENGGIARQISDYVGRVIMKIADKDSDDEQE